MCALSRQRASPTMSSSCLSSSTTSLMLGMSFSTHTLCVYGLYRRENGRWIVFANSLWRTKWSTYMVKAKQQWYGMQKYAAYLKTDLPHSKFGFLEALRNKVNILKGGDETLLFTGDIGLKGQDFRRAWERVLQNKTKYVCFSVIHFS